MVALPARSAGRSGSITLVSRPGQRVVEFMAAADPTRPDVIAATAISLDGADVTDISCVVFVSEDAGHHWTMSRPFAPSHGGDPWVAWDRFHRLHATCLSLDDALVHYAFSRDDGRHWIPGASPAGEGNPPPGQDKDSITATRDGDLLTCDQERVPAPALDTVLGTNLRLFAYRSSDLGRTWSREKVATTRDAPAMCNGFALGPRGQVSTALERLSLTNMGGVRVRIGVLTSREDGRSWERPVMLGTSEVAYSIINDLQPASHLPTVAADQRSGAVYAASSMRTDRWTVRFWRSLDGGRSFHRSAAPKPKSTLCRTADEMNPTLDVAPGGTVGMVFTCKSDLKTELMREVWFATSTNHGRSWLPPVLLSRQQAPNTNTNPEAQMPNPYAGTFRYDAAGDYWGLTTTRSGFLAMWIDYRNGFPQLWARRIASPSS